MAGANEIRAGKAFVEAYLDKTKLTRGLKSVGGDLKAFGAGIASLGAQFMALGAGVVAPLLAATKVFADAGSQLNDMSNRTGMSVEALGELKYAAEQTGTSLEAVEAGVRKMQKAIDTAAGKPLKSRDQLDKVLAGLQNKSPEEQFAAVAAGLQNIDDYGARAARAMEIFGKSGTQLLPMLGDLDALKQRARELGLVMSTEDAAAADAMGDAMDNATGSLKAATMAIGAALAPVLTTLAERFANGVSAVRAWISEHKPLVVMLLAAGVAAVAAGVGLFAFGKIVVLAGTMLTGLITIAKAAAATFAFLQSAVLLLANPFVLVGAAAVALGGYLLYATGAAGKAATWISQTFATILSEVTSAFGVIAESMAAGDFTAAAKVGWALVKLEWSRGVAFISSLWEGFKGLYDEAVSGIVIGWINATASIHKAWVNLINALAKAWNDWATSGFVESITNRLILGLGLAMGKSDKEIAEWQKTAKEDFARGRDNRGANAAAMDNSAAEQRAQIERDRQAQVDIVGSDLNRRKQQRDTRNAALQSDADRAKKELEQAQRDAQAAAKDAKAKGNQFAFGDKLPGMDAVDLSAAGSGPKSTVRGTFAASAVSGLGVDSVQVRIAKAAEKTFKFVGEQTSVLKDIRGKLQAAP